MRKILMSILFFCFINIILSNDFKITSSRLLADHTIYITSLSRLADYKVYITSLSRLADHTIYVPSGSSEEDVQEYIAAMIVVYEEQLKEKERLKEEEW